MAVASTSKLKVVEAVLAGKEEKKALNQLLDKCSWGSMKEDLIKDIVDRREEECEGTRDCSCFTLSKSEDSEMSVLQI